MKNLKKNYFYNLIYQLFTLIVPIFVTPYLARVLFSEGQGKYSFTYSIASYFVLFALLGFNIYAQRKISSTDDKNLQSKYFWEIFILKSISTIISFSIFSVVVFFDLCGEQYKLLLWVQSLQIIAVFFDITFLYQGNEEFGKIAFRNVVIKAFNIICIFLFVKNDGDLLIYTIIQSSSTFISSITLWFGIKKYLVKINIKDLKPVAHLKDTLILFIPTIAQSIYTFLDKTILGFIINDDSIVGCYDTADKIVRLALTVITAIATIYTPRNSYYYNNDMDKELKENTNFLCKFVCFAGFPMMLGLIAISNNFVPWYLGYEYGKDNIEMVILFINLLSPIIIFIGLDSVIGGAYLVPIHKDLQYTISVCSGAIVNFALNILFINLFGTLGAIFATLIAEIIVSISMIYFTRKEIQYFAIFKSVWKCFVAGIIMFVICFCLSNFLVSSILNTFVITIIGVSIYLIVLVILKEKLVYDFFDKMILKIKNKL